MLKLLIPLAVLGFIQCDAAAANFDMRLSNFADRKILELQNHRDEITGTLDEILNGDDGMKLDEKVEMVRQTLVEDQHRCSEKALKHLEAVKDITCPNLDDLVGTSGDLVINTTTIVTGIVHEFYLILGTNKTCGDLGEFRCFLRKISHMGETFSDVGNKIVNYKTNAAKIAEIYKEYFSDCSDKTTDLLRNVLHERKICQQLSSISI